MEERRRSPRERKNTRTRRRKKKRTGKGKKGSKQEREIRKTTREGKMEERMMFRAGFLPDVLA